MTPWTITCQAPLSMGVLKTRILEWVAVLSSRGSSQPKDGTQVSTHCRQILYCLTEPPGKLKNTGVGSYPFSSGSSWLRNQTRVSCTAGGFFPSWVTREVHSINSTFSFYKIWQELLPRSCSQSFAFNHERGYDPLLHVWLQFSLFILLSQYCSRPTIHSICEPLFLSYIII